MAKFNVTVTETLEKVIEVEAGNGFDAVDVVRRLYRNEEIVLGADDHTGTDFTVKGPLVNDRKDLTQRE